MKYHAEPSKPDRRYTPKDQTAFMRGVWWRVAGADGHTAAYVPEELTARLIARALTAHDEKVGRDVF